MRPDMNRRRNEPQSVPSSDPEAVAGNQFHLFALDVCKFKSFAEVLEQVHRNDGLSKSVEFSACILLEVGQQWEVEQLRKHTSGTKSVPSTDQNLKVPDTFSTSSRSILVEL